MKLKKNFEEIKLRFNYSSILIGDDKDGKECMEKINK
jgi:hypothetical protein